MNNRDKESWLQKQLENLRRNLKERTESDDVLQTELDQYEHRMKLQQDYRQTKGKEYESLNHKIDSIRQKSRSKDITAGKYEQQKATHEREVENRNILIKESARRHGVRGFENDLSDVQVSDCMEKLSKLQEDRASAADRARLELDREMQEVQVVLSKLGEQKSVFQENKKSVKRQSESNDQLIASSQSELSSIEIDEGGAAIIESNIEDTEAKLGKAKDHYKASCWDQKINESKGVRRSLDDDIERTNRELDEGLKRSKELARVDLLKKDRDDRQRASESLIKAHNDRFQNIIGMDWQLSTLEQDFQRVLEKRINKVRDLTQKRDSTSRDLEQIEFRLDSLRTERRKAETALDSSRKTVIDATREPSPGTYPRDLENCQNDRDTLKADADDYAITRKLYSKSIKTAEVKNKCELCQREFHNAERSHFVQKMERKIAENTYLDIQSQLKEVEDDLKKMRAAGPSHSTWLRLSSSELPRLCSEIKVLEGSRADLLQRVESHDQLVSDAEESRRDNESLSKTVTSITKHQTEIRNINDQRDKLIAEQQGAGLCRTIDEIKEQLDSLHVQRRAKQENIEKLEADRAQADRYIANKELELRDARDEWSRAKNQLEKKAGISRRIDDLRRANHDHRESVKRLDNQIQGLTPQVSEQEAKREDINQRGLKKERELRKEASDLLDSVRKLRLADQNIQVYLDSGGPSRLAQCEREIRGLQEEIEQVEAQKKQLIIEINKLDVQLGDQEQTKKSIMENITYRQNQRDLEAIRTEISNLSAQNAEADLQHHQRQATHWQNKHDLYNGQRSGKIGTITAKDDELQRLLQDWQTSYKDAAQDYKKAHIQVEVSVVTVY